MADLKSTPEAPAAVNMPGAGSLRTRLASSVGAQSVTFVLWSILQLLAVPVFVGHWGTAVYADWLTLNAGVGMLTLLDAGVGVHITNLLIAAVARNEGTAVVRIFASGLAMLSALAAAGAVAVAAAAATGLPALIGIDRPGAGLAGAMLAATTLLLLPRIVVTGVLAAHGRFALAVWLTGAVQVIPLAGQLVVVWRGGGIVAAAAIHLAATLIVGWAFTLVVLRRVLPGAGIGLRWPPRAGLAGYIRKSALHSLTTGATTVTQHVPVLVLQAFAPSGAMVVLFTTMRTLVGLLRQVAAQVIQSSAIEMARQHSQGDRAGLRDLYLLTVRVVGGTAGLLGGLLLAIGPDFVALWTHGTIAFDVRLAAAFAGSTILVVPGMTALLLLRMTDHAEQLAQVHAAQIILIVALCLLLTPALDGVGAALAVAGAEVLTIGWMMFGRAGRLFDLGGLRSLPVSGLAALAGLTAGAAAAFAVRSVLPGAGLPDLVMVSAAWSVVVAPVAPFIALPPQERMRIAHWIARCLARPPHAR